MTLDALESVPRYHDWIVEYFSPYLGGMVANQDRPGQPKPDPFGSSKSREQGIFSPRYLTQRKMLQYVFTGRPSKPFA